jgi:hypothetical protein
MARPFFETLRELRGGTTLAELGDGLTLAVAHVKATGKTAELTLKIKIKAPRKGAVDYIAVEDEVIVKIPKEEHSETIFFPTADNSLSRTNPRQQSLDLKPVPDEEHESTAGSVA